MKRSMYIRFAGSAALAALLASTGTSYAASSRCDTGLGRLTCETPKAVHANTINHFIHVQVSVFQTWRVIDVDMNVQVANGTSGIFGLERTVTGLTNNYKGQISNIVTSGLTGGHITISNT